MNIDHVVVHDEVDGSFELRCNHCADFHHPRLPIRADHLADRLLGFVRMHRLCPKPEVPSPQLPLPHTEAKPSLDYPCKAPHRNGRHEVYRDEETVICRACGASEVDADPDPFAIDGSTDEPAPEIDPPGPYALFDRMYPLADSVIALRAQLKEVLTPEQFEKGLSWVIPHPSTGIFNAVANWARIEKAHAEAGSREPIAGLTIPRREPMPVKLAELLGEKPKERRGERPLTSPKRKRRSIMEQNST